MGDIMKLNKKLWDEFDYNRLSTLINENKHDNNYIVLDWDFTCIFNDTQMNLFMYQIDNLKFKLNPNQFDKVMRYGIADLDKLSEIENLAGEKLNARVLIDDVNDCYKFIYNNYIDFNGNMSLAEIKETEQFNDFKCKLYTLMIVAFRVSSIDLSQSFSTGYTIKQYNKLLENAIDFALDKNFEIVDYTSSNSGKAKACKINFKYGIKLRDEIKDLINVCKANGITTYICSASQIDNVKFFGSYDKYGYNIYSNNIFGRRRIIDENGIITINDDENYPFTYKDGKTQTIIDYIMPKHDNKAPILIAGDSDGDFDMMNYFQDSALLLIYQNNLYQTKYLSTFIDKGLAEKSKNNQNCNIIVLDKKLC